MDPMGIYIYKKTYKKRLQVVSKNPGFSHHFTVTSKPSPATRCQVLMYEERGADVFVPGKSMENQERDSCLI